MKLPLAATKVIGAFNDVVLELWSIDPTPNVVHLVVRRLEDAAGDGEQYHHQHSQLNTVLAEAVQSPVIFVLTPGEREGLITAKLLPSLC